MSKDYRMSFVRDVETALAASFTREQIAMVSNIVIKALDAYEITERCTDLVPLDDGNEKLIKRYKACLLVDGKSEKTIYQYDRTLHRFSDTMGKPFQEVGIYDVRFYLAMEQERGISARTRENTRANLSAFFQWMTDEDIINKNPIAKMKRVKYPAEVRKPFSDVEIDALRSACRTLKDRAILEMLLSTGVRVSELASMEVDDINLDDLSVHVIHGKGAKERITYTTTVSAKHLRAYLSDRKENGSALFYNRFHEQMKSGGIRLILNELSKRAGVSNVHPHRFRRTFATGLAKRGMEIQEIQKLLGHSDISTTMTYVCVGDKETKASYSKYIA